MKKLFGVKLIGLFLTACEGMPDQTSRAYMSEYCIFDPISWQEDPPGSPGHTLCMELWETDIDPDDDVTDGDGDGDNN